MESRSREWKERRDGEQ
jgi:hypothetical protein